MKAYTFLEEDAVEYGVDGAVILFGLRFWCEKNAANGKNVQECPDGLMRAWTYNSGTAMSKIYPFWSDAKIRKTLRELENRGIIYSARFNNKPYDQTKWYTVKTEQCIVTNGTLTVTNGTITDPNETINRSNSDNQSFQLEQPIPVISTVNNHSKKKKANATHPLTGGPMNLTTYQKLVEEWGEKVVDDYMERVVDYEASVGKTYEDHAGTVRNWLKRDFAQGKVTKPEPYEKPMTIEEQRKEIFG